MKGIKEREYVYIEPETIVITADEETISLKLKHIFSLRKEEALSLLAFLEKRSRSKSNPIEAAYYIYKLFKKNLPEYACTFDKSVDKFRLSKDLGLM